MKILLVNDDGYKCKGILELAKVLSTAHEVVVVAPDKEKSGFSHSLSFGVGLKHKKHKAQGFTLYSLNGTPSDCVKYGHVMLYPEAECVISGINTTMNLGNDCIYSGTVNAAHEAAILGLKGIAVSAEVRDGSYHDSAEFVLNNLDKLLAMCGDERIVSINIPKQYKEDIKGVEITRVGYRRYKDWYEKVKHKRGMFIKGYPLPHDDEPDTDLACVKEDKISISPIKLYFYEENLSQFSVEDICW